MYIFFKIGFVDILSMTFFYFPFSLNVLIIRRYIVDDLRGPKKTDDDKTPAIPEQPATKLSYKGFVSANMKSKYFLV